jgi:hypothetical protein
VATKVLVFLVVAIMGGSIVYGLFGSGTTTATAPAPRKSAAPERRIAADAKERYAGVGIWSAWRPYPPHAGGTTTVLWRTAGFVPRSVRLAGAGGNGGRLRVAFAPTRVIPPLAGAGFAWHRAGVEWGSKLVFPTAGLWTLRIVAGDRHGRITLRVVE